MSIRQQRCSIGSSVKLGQCAYILAAILVCTGTTGCTAVGSFCGKGSARECPLARKSNPRPVEKDDRLVGVSGTLEPTPKVDRVRHAGFQIEPTETPDLNPASENPSETERTSPSGWKQSVAALSLTEVVDSIYRSYPLLIAAMEEQAIAAGNRTSAEGEFDLRLKAESLNGPSGFYQTYRHAAGVEQPVYSGGSVFGGYRVGRGEFQPWYLERQTNDGGEFRAGITMPLARNREIDSRRAALWLAGYDVEGAEPFIRLQLIDFIRAGSLAYWEWVAAGRQVAIARNLLQIAEVRKSGLKLRIDEGDLPRIELTDNERLIVTRRAKLIDVERKLRQSAVKLSLFLRTEAGEPTIPDDRQLPSEFPVFDEYSEAMIADDVTRAIQQRPELKLLDLQQRQIEVQMSQAENDLQPSVDLTVAGSQDVGAPTSRKRDKSQFELEAGIVAQVPVQRRKARGKLASLEGKLSQVRSKTQFTSEKITAEIQSAAAGLIAAAGRSETARRSLELTRTMEQAERTRFEAGESNLLLVNLREQASADAEALLVEAQQAYFQSLVNLRAAAADNISTATTTE